MRRIVGLALAVVLAVSVLPWFSLSSILRAKTLSSAPAPMQLKVGDSAPDFTLRDQNGKEVSLKDFRGKKTVALAFYVFAFSGG